ncbi:MAG: type II toxin-antitoxin system RelE/ParE family toxin [Akkermansiaceae bacterium]|nr:type II toxin-antitoxin system RelE/ParE family toxin [Akkermansiaceae bacterium]
MNLILSPSAIRDLQGISDYTYRTWGAEQEERYLKGLWEKLSQIQSSPDSCRQRDDLAKDCRSTRYEKHVIFFTIHGKKLQIIRILHGSMDFQRHL